MLFDLSHAQDFFDGCLAVFYFVPPVGAQSAHSVFNCAGGNSGRRRAAQYKGPQALVDDEQFIDAFAALVTELAAFFTAGAAPKSCCLDLIFRKTDAF